MLNKKGKENGASSPWLKSRVSAPNISMKGIQKNQTVKKAYTIIILNDMGDEVDRQRVVAESPREALTKAYPMIFTKETP